MKLYNVKCESGARAVVLDDMILTKDMPTAAGSKMLEKFIPLFSAEVVERLEKSGYEISGKTNVGEFGLDLMGETSFFGATEVDGKLSGAAATLIKNGDVKAALNVETKRPVVSDNSEPEIKQPEIKQEKEPIATFRLEVTAPASKLMALRKFIDANGITYKKI